MPMIRGRLPDGIRPFGMAAPRSISVPQLFALNRSMAVARSASGLAVISFAIVTGRGDRTLLILALALTVVGSAVFWAWRRNDASDRDELRVLAALPGWTIAAVVVALAVKDPATGTYHHEILMAIVAPLAVSFGLVLRPAVGTAWLAATATLLFAATRAVTPDEANDLSSSLALILAGGVAILGRIGLERLADDRRELAALSAHVAGMSGPEAIAGAVVDEVFGWKRFGLVWIVAFEATENGRLLAQRAIDMLPTAVPAGGMLPRGRARYLRERAERGPWIEALSEESMVAYGLPPKQFAGCHAYVPLESDGAPFGLLIAGTWAARGRDSSRRESLAALTEALPLLLDVAAIASGFLGPTLRDRDETAAERTRLEAVIAGRAFHPVFQPIVRIGTGAVVGYEALTRFDDGTAPDGQFADAARLGLGPQLELATLHAALEASADLPAVAFLSVNVSPQLATSGALRGALAGSPRPLIVELTEHVAVVDYAELRAAIAGLGSGVRLAVDDAGAGFASLRHVLELQPDIVKLDRRLIHGIDTDPVRQSLVAGMRHFAQETRFELLAEGIESEAELAMLRDLGVGLAQGYLFGRPETAPLAAPSLEASNGADRRSVCRLEPAASAQPLLAAPSIWMWRPHDDAGARPLADADDLFPSVSG